MKIKNPIEALKILEVDQDASMDENNEEIGTSSQDMIEQARKRRAKKHGLQRNDEDITNDSDNSMNKICMNNDLLSYKFYWSLIF